VLPKHQPNTTPKIVVVLAVVAAKETENVVHMFGTSVFAEWGNPWHTQWPPIVLSVADSLDIFVPTVIEHRLVHESLSPAQLGSAPVNL
jgi:hypothetical protein